MSNYYEQKQATLQATCLTQLHSNLLFRENFIKFLTDTQKGSITFSLWKECVVTI